MKTISKIFLILISSALLVSCTQTDQDVKTAYAGYISDTSMENFQTLCRLAQNSENVKFQTIYCFSVVGDFMHPGTPTHSRSEEKEAKAYMKKHASSLGSSLEVVLSKSPTRLGRSSAAKVIGMYGDQHCLPVLKRSLEHESDEVVADAIRMAIEEVETR